MGCQDVVVHVIAAFNDLDHHSDLVGEAAGSEVACFSPAGADFRCFNNGELEAAFAVLRCVSKEAAPVETKILDDAFRGPEILILRFSRMLLSLNTASTFLPVSRWQGVKAPA